jgi:hypothetical protein
MKKKKKKKIYNFTGNKMRLHYKYQLNNDVYRNNPYLLLKHKSLEQELLAKCCIVKR